MNMNTISSDFKVYPSVFAVEDEYQIIIPTKKELLMWIRVGDEEYFDDSNGILRSSSPIHRISVPMEELDRAKKYTVCYRRVVKRKPYGTKTKGVEEYTYTFNPVEKGKPLNVYHISDSHGRIEESVKSAKNAGDIDLLILNGDIASHSGSVKNIEIMYHIAAGVTKGRVPCVFSRGNHDLRGSCAEFLEDYTPNYNGKSYYTFRLGDIWGMVLDCGEDKSDSDEEYGNTICCRNFRKRELNFINCVADKKEYEDSDIKYKLVICHMPFTYRGHIGDKFDIENDMYDEWSRIIRESIKPNLILYGHTHTVEFSLPGGKLDSRGQGCPVLIGARPRLIGESDKDGFTGSLIRFDYPDVKATFVDNQGNRQSAGEFRIK